MQARGSLRGQLLRWMVGALSLVLLLDAAGSYYFASQLADRVYDGELMEIARELVLHVHRDGTRTIVDLESDAERTLLLDQVDTVTYAIHAADGALLAGSTALTVNHASAPVTAYFADVGGEPVRVAQLRVPGSQPDPVVVQVAETLHKRTALTREMLADVILPQLVFIVMAGLLVSVGVTRGLAPLRTLQAAVAARSHLDLSPIEARDIPAEVDPLLQSVNDLMARLDEVLTFQNRFIADAAHQLRTPVAGLKAHIEVALREPDPEQARRSLAHLYTAVERMSRLVAQLLSLARNEPNTVRRLNLAAIDLGRLALDTTMEWVPEAYKKNIDLGFEGAAGPATIRGDAARLRELINNLLDNAIRYSRDGGKVTVRVTADPDPRVAVSDDGPTIPPAERERIFERFHRLLGHHTDGSGLGLAIVREIATLHQATISLTEDADGVGNTFTVAFPAAAAAVESSA
ncbi:MAG TPA: ATP-binding protein [Casimicrobiaceae bacterium]|nr:ATP-binding protein [Casimicrobiaceae bacterium]